MITKERGAFLEVMKSLTGSIMTHDRIMSEYTALTPTKRAYIYSKVHKSLKHLTAPINKTHPLVVVAINTIAAEDNIDPAVVLLTYIDKKNKRWK